MPIARADIYSPTDIQVIYYSDFVPTLDLNPITGLIATVNNEDSVKQSIYYLILTSIGERFIDNISLGCKIKTLLFDPDDFFSRNLVQQAVVSTITNYEPRASLLQVDVNTAETGVDIGEYQIAISVYFNIINTNQQSFITVFLKRVR